MTAERDLALSCSTSNNLTEHASPCQDPLSDFLTAYAEYLAGARLYEDLPPAFTTCPATPHCGMTICAQCHPGTAALYDQSRAVAAYFRLRGDIWRAPR